MEEIEAIESLIQPILTGKTTDTDVWYEAFDEIDERVKRLKRRYTDALECLAPKKKEKRETFSEHVEWCEKTYNMSTLIQQFPTDIRNVFTKGTMSLFISFVVGALKKGWNVFLTEDEENYIAIYRNDTAMICCGTEPPKYRQTLIPGSASYAEQLDRLESFLYGEKTTP